jgi:hypothetical protein
LIKSGHAQGGQRGDRLCLDDDGGEFIVFPFRTKSFANVPLHLENRNNKASWLRGSQAVAHLDRFVVEILLLCLFCPLIAKTVLN